MAQKIHAGARWPVRSFLLTAAVVVALSGTALAQAVRGTLLGTVTDSQRGIVPNVAVTATETQTNVARTATTNPSGHYVFANLKDGIYRIEAELAGFKKVVRDGIDVKVNSTVRVDLTLEVGPVTETIQVTRESPALQTDRADTGRQIEGREVASLPLGQNRSFQGMWATVPGSVQVTRPHSAFFNPQDSQETKFNGQSRYSNSVQIDGLDDNQKTGLLTVLIPSAESIDSVNVSTSNFDAEFGRAGGSVTTVVLKSGTNQFKGSLFGFGNTEATQAKNAFASATSTKADTKYQQLGATLGGPIAKDKAFFFVDYQKTVDNLGTTRRAVVPPAQWRTGNFSTATTTIYDPATGKSDGTGRTPFLGNVIPVNRISPVALNILALMPAPNINNVAYGQSNYEYNGTREKTIDAINTKLNFNPTPSNQLSIRFSLQRLHIFDPGTYGVYGGPNGGGFAGAGNQRTYSAAATWTKMLSPSLIMEWRAGYMQYSNTALTEGHGLATSTDVGIPGVNYDEWTSGLTQIQINQGYSNPVIGFSGSLPWDRGEKNWSVVGMITKLAGDHTIKLGAEGRHNEDFLLQSQEGGGVRGIFNFSAAQTAIPSDSKAQAGLANSFASFLLDQPGSIQRDVKVLDRPGTQHYAFFGFVQDKWQVTKQLTADLGLRWEYYTPLVGIENPGGLANYDKTNNTIHVAGYGDNARNLGVKSNWSNFAPRLGLAYRVDEKTVLRAGFGTSIIPFPDNRYAFNFPVKQTNQFRAPNSFSTAGSMAQGLTPPTFYKIPENGIIDANIPQLKNSAVFAVPTDLKEAKIHSWNVAFQRELPWHIVAEVAYVGNVAKGVLADSDLNVCMTMGAGNAGRPYNQLYGRTAAVRDWQKRDTQYNALQAKLDRRFRDSLLITTSYTFGRAINYSDDNGWIGTMIAPERDKGRGGFDRTHVFASSFIWDIPFFKKGNGLPHSVLGGWQVSGIFTAYSGTPINFTAPDATLNTPGNQQRPDVSGDPKVLGNIGPGQLYFDTSVFSAPAPNTFGNMTRNDSINGPGFWNLDASVVKRFKCGKIATELRADAFNLTNSPHFNNPNGSYGSATFGQVTSSFGERLVRFGARLLF